MTAGDDTHIPGSGPALEAPLPLDEDRAAQEEAELAAVLGGPSDSHLGEPEPIVHDAPRTRDLLSEIADRHHAARPRPELEANERQFVRWLLAAVLIACAALLALLWWLDPISVTGRQTRFSVVENGGVRQAKLDLMDELAEAPEVLVLGSSRSMKLDPEEIERVSGASAFNGGVSGGTTQDIYLYARYAEQLWGAGGTAAGTPRDEYPHLVIGVVHDVMRFTGTAALDPRLKRFLPKADRDQGNVLEQAEQLLQLKTLEGAARAVRRVTRRDGWGAVLDPEQDAGRVDAALATAGKQKSNQRENLSPRGMQLFKPGADYSTSLDARIEAQMTTFVRNSYEADADFSGVDPRGLDFLRRTIAMANRHGDVPTLWVTPYAPEAVQYLPEDEWRDRDRAFRDAVAQLQEEGELEFSFIDLADLESFGGTATDWYDGIHMTEANTARVIAALHGRDALAPRS